MVQVRLRNTDPANVSPLRVLKAWHYLVMTALQVSVCVCLYVYIWVSVCICLYVSDMHVHITHPTHPNPNPTHNPPTSPQLCT